MVKLSKKEEKEVEKEVRKRIHKRVYEKTRDAGMRFKKEFKKHTVTAITAAFAFLIALSWRAPIQSSVSNLIERLGLVGKEIYIEYLSAISITIIAVLGIMWVSKWSSEN
tara:strand:- start:100 stop:429 length:330 start_codon:yes stop_codon:yes gene_type:complete